MQVKKIAAVCALACTAMAGSAHAALSTAAIADLNAANAGNRIIFVSGASAVQKGFTSIVAKTFTGTPIYYSVKGNGKSTKVSDADFVAVSGTLASGTGTWAGQKGIIIYRVKGGSVWGVNPVARNESIESMLINSTACGTTGTGTSTDPYSCGTANRTPDAGVSDVAPGLFKYGVNTEGEVPAAELNETELVELTATPLYGLAFGVPVTSTVSSSLKLTRSTVAAIMTNNVGTWDQIGAETGDIVICRRVPGSGTQAVMNLWAGNFPGEFSQAPADRDSSGAWDAAAHTFTVNAGTGALVVVENSTSGNVRDCLNKAVTGGSYTTADRDGNPVTVTFNGAGHKAIGVLSMDSLADSTSAANWQFRSIDGAGRLVQDIANAAPTKMAGSTGKFPTFDEYENGDWDLQGWVSFNVPSRTTGPKLEVLDFFKKTAQDPAILQGISSLKFVAAAIPGGDYSGPFVLDAAYANGDQRAPYNRNSND